MIATIYWFWLDCTNTIKILSERSVEKSFASTPGMMDSMDCLLLVFSSQSRAPGHALAFTSTLTISYTLASPLEPCSHILALVLYILSVSESIILTSLRFCHTLPSFAHVHVIVYIMSQSLIVSHWNPSSWDEQGGIGWHWKISELRRVAGGYERNVSDGRGARGEAMNVNYSYFKSWCRRKGRK